MPREIPTILRALADLYQKSAAGSHAGTRDFTYDHELLLRHANCADGDDREAAEEDLKRAETESNGLLSLDRDSRSSLPLRVRLARTGGETWLFERIGLIPPSARRSELAEFFRTMAMNPVPAGIQEKWCEWCHDLEIKGMSQASVQPFKRDDPADNERFLDALLGVIHWQGESLIRYASAVICNDSKRLQIIEPRLLTALGGITGASSLEAFGILHKPRTVMIHGPLVFGFGSASIDFGTLPGPVSISEINLAEATSVGSSATVCISVENEDVFLELAKRNPGVLLVATSFPGAAVRRLFGLLPPSIRCHHFGDTDPAGFDILRDLREKTGRKILPLMMEPRRSHAENLLTAPEKQTLVRLLESPVMKDLHPLLEGILASGVKGSFEQESIPLELVLAVIRNIAAEMTEQMTRACSGHTYLDMQGIFYANGVQSGSPGLASPDAYPGNMG